MVTFGESKALRADDRVFPATMDHRTERLIRRNRELLNRAALVRARTSQVLRSLIRHNRDMMEQAVQIHGDTLETIAHTEYALQITRETLARGRGSVRPSRAIVPRLGWGRKQIAQ